jgi:hypothetical protein
MPEAGTPPNEALVESLFKSLRDTREICWRRRISAASTLQEFPLTAEQRIEFRDILRTTLLKPEGTGKQVLIAGWRVLALIATISLTLTNTYRDYTFFPAGDQFIISFIVLSFFSLPTIFPLLLVLRANLDRRVRIAFLYTLECMGDPLSTDALAVAACDPCSHVSNVADSALVTVLPTLKPEHYGQLASTTVPNLCRILEDRPRSHYPSAPLMNALLAALEKIGDVRAIPTLQRLIKFGPKNRQEEAQRLLGILKERHEQEIQSSILLRAARPPTTAPEELLRPAATTIATAPEQLLRPSSVTAPEIRIMALSEANEESRTVYVHQGTGEEG